MFIGQGFIHNAPPSAPPNQFSRGVVDKTLYVNLRSINRDATLDSLSAR